MTPLTACCQDKKQTSEEGQAPLMPAKVVHVLQTNAFAAGSLSAVSTTLLLQPFDLVKTRLQRHAISHSARIKITAVISDVVTRESIVGLWKGTTPSLLRNVPGIGLFAGAAARTFTGVVLLPMTVLKTKFESGLFRYTSLRHALVHIYSHEGLMGLFRGSSATLLRDVPYSGMYLMFYSQMKRSTASSNPSLTFACGLAAGLLASLITHPFDVLKTKMQLCSVDHVGLIRTSVSIFRQRGASSFYSGMAPRIMRRSLMSALSWTIFESLARH